MTKAQDFFWAFFLRRSRLRGWGSTSLSVKETLNTLVEADGCAMRNGTSVARRATTHVPATVSTRCLNEVGSPSFALVITQWEQGLLT